MTPRHLRNALTELKTKASLLDVLNNASFFFVFTFFRLIVLPFWMYGFWFNLNPSSPGFHVNMVTLASCVSVFLLSVFWYAGVAFFFHFWWSLGHCLLQSIVACDDHDHEGVMMMMMMMMMMTTMMMSVTGSSKW
jgi:hypothetical protein